MKREQIINKIYDKIRDDLLHALLLYWEEDDANKYPLVDHLSSGNDISTGRDEIDNLIEQIEIEPLIDAILALPLDVPSEEEINNCWRYGYVCLPTACQLSQTIKGTLTIPLVSGM
jgi:hypothetical protein